MKTDIKDIIRFLGDEVKFDEFGSGYLLGKNPDGGDNIIAEIRGYGAIQRLFINEYGVCDFKKADQFQMDLGGFIAQAINDKIYAELSGGKPTHVIIHK